MKQVQAARTRHTRAKGTNPGARAYYRASPRGAGQVPDFGFRACSWDPAGAPGRRPGPRFGFRGPFWGPGAATGSPIQLPGPVLGTRASPRGAGRVPDLAPWPVLASSINACTTPAADGRSQQYRTVTPPSALEPITSWRKTARPRERRAARGTDNETRSDAASMPTPTQPLRSTTSRTTEPSPDPRSTNTSSGPTAAELTISSATSIPACRQGERHTGAAPRPSLRDHPGTRKPGRSSTHGTRKPADTATSQSRGDNPSA